MTERNQARDAERLPETAARRLLERGQQARREIGVRLDFHRSVAGPASMTKEKTIVRMERITRIAMTGPKERSRVGPSRPVK